MKQSRNLLIIHVLGWLLFLSLPLTIISRGAEPGIEMSLLSSWSFWLFFLIYVLLFYFNLLVLVPRLFLRQRYFLYALVFSAGLTTIYLAQPFENLIFQNFKSGQRHSPELNMLSPDEFRQNMPPPPPRRSVPHHAAVDFVSLILFIVIWVIGVATKLSEQWRLSEKRAILSEADKAKAELLFLKAQINPHFLFNTLNNVYSMAVSQSEHTAPSIMKLSEMMRYITEEATADFVPLEDEIACLVNYIELQKFRLSAKTHVNFLVDGAVDNMQIAPLILMNFVENAFKYGISNHTPSEIDIHITATENEIRFQCKNTIFARVIQPEREGVGIANTKKRLNYLYPDKHALVLSSDHNLFLVDLKLPAT